MVEGKKGNNVRIRKNGQVKVTQKRGERQERESRLEKRSEVK